MDSVVIPPETNMFFTDLRQNQDLQRAAEIDAEVSNQLVCSN